MGLKPKGFDGHIITTIGEQLNQFLETIDEKNFVEFKLVVTKREGPTATKYYSAILIYKD
jgi:Sporulation protein Cse60